MKHENGIKKLRGLALIRVSSKAQAEVQFGSLEQQQSLIERFLRHQGDKDQTVYEIEEWVQEDISGTQKAIKKRKGYQRILRAIDRKEIDFVIFEKIDRLSRSIVDNHSFLKLAQERDVLVFDAESGLIDLRQRGVRLTTAFKSMMAEEYSVELAEKVTKKGREAKVNNGKDTSTRPVLGLDAHPTLTCMYVINSDEQKVIQDIFRFFVRCGSLKKTVDYCDDRGYRTKKVLTKEKISKEGVRIPPRVMGGKEFSINSLRCHLSNPKYLGKGKFKDTLDQFPELQNEDGYVFFDYQHGPVVPVDLFEKAQKILTENKRKHRTTSRTDQVYLLSHVLKSKDGKSFYGASAKSGAHRYYCCSETNERIPKSKIEKRVIDGLIKVIDRNEVWDSLFKKVKAYEGTSREPDTTHLDLEIKELEKAIDGFSQALMNAAKTNSTNLHEVCAALLEEKKKAEAQLKSLEYKRKNVRNAQAAPAASTDLDLNVDSVKKDLLQKLRGTPTEATKQLIQSLVPEIIVYPEKNELELKIGILELLENCDGGKKVLLSEKWRGRRDSNPRPPA